MFRSLALIVLLTISGALHAAVPPSLSGSWYDPAQPGHGLSLQVLGDGRAIAYWFTYDRAGNPLHLYLDGRIDDRTIRGIAYAASGMRFGAFDPAALGVGRWGELEIEFSTDAGCESAILRYEGNGEAGVGFGTGTLPLVRLSRIAGTICSSGDIDPLETGLWTGAYHRLPSAFPLPAGTPLEAAIDTDGSLWAFSTDAPLGPTWVGAFVPPVVVPAGSSVEATAFGRILPNFAFYPPHVPSNPELLGALRTAFPLRSAGAGRSTGGSQRGLDTLQIAFAHDTTTRVLAGRLDPATLSGATFTALTRGQFITLTLTATFSADGAVCMRFPDGFVAGNCYLQGRIGVRSTTHRFFDFELTEPANGRVYRGRGWVHAENPAVPTRVVFVGSSADGIGLGIGMDRR